MDTLTQEGMRPRALCQVAEVVNEDWRAAAEALLGRDREAILVDPEHAPRAVSILRGSRDTYRGCRIANTRRLAELPRDPVAGTLASVLRSDDPLAMAFIVFRAGTVALADPGRHCSAAGARSCVMASIIAALSLKFCGCRTSRSDVRRFPSCWPSWQKPLN